MLASERAGRKKKAGGKKGGKKGAATAEGDGKKGAGDKGGGEGGKKGAAAAGGKNGEAAAAPKKTKKDLTVSCVPVAACVLHYADDWLEKGSSQLHLPYCSPPTATEWHTQLCD